MTKNRNACNKKRERKRSKIACKSKKAPPPSGKKEVVACCKNWIFPPAPYIPFHHFPRKLPRSERETERDPLEEAFSASRESYLDGRRFHMMRKKSRSKQAKRRLGTTSTPLSFPMISLSVYYYLHRYTQACARAPLLFSPTKS